MPAAAFAAAFVAAFAAVAAAPAAAVASAVASASPLSIARTTPTVPVARVKSQAVRQPDMVLLECWLFPLHSQMQFFLSRTAGMAETLCQCVRSAMPVCF